MPRIVPRGSPPDEEVQRARVRRLYDEKSAAYSTAREGGFLGWLAARDLLDLWTHLSPRPGLRALDAGCGDGRHGALLRAEGLTVWGIDLSPRMVAAAAPRLHGALCLDLSSEEALAQLAARSGGAFDRVLCVGALEFVADAAAALRALARLLSPGGVLVLQVPRRSVFAWPYALWQRQRHGVRVRLWDEALLTEAARGAGLSLRRRTRPFLHTVTLSFQRPSV